MVKTDCRPISASLSNSPWASARWSVTSRPDLPRANGQRALSGRLQGAAPDLVRTQAASHRCPCPDLAGSPPQTRCRARRCCCGVIADGGGALEALDDPALFEPWFRGPTWNPWRVVLKAIFALEMTAEEKAFFRSIADREPPAEPCREVFIVAGRRAGKDSIASLLASNIAAMFNDSDGRLRPGERALISCLAVDRDQARIVLNYCRAFFTDIPLLQHMVERETAYGFELSNRVDISVSTNSFRSVRGRPVLCGIFDEIAFWRDDNSANPDEEVYAALKPGLASLPGSLVIGISSPYRRSGLLHKKFRDHYGKDSKTLVIRAPTRILNPLIDQSIIDEAMLEDPAAASAEWMGEFRDDISAFVTRDAVDACVAPDIFERARVQGVKYQAFVDPSGGASESMTLAIAHSQLSEDKKRSVAVLDAVREIRAPFSPEDAVAEFAALLKTYGIRTVRGDRSAAEWVTEAFRKTGIE